MVDGLTRTEAMDNLGFTRAALKELIICWMEDTGRQNRQFFLTGREREIDGLVTRIRNIPKRRRS